MPSSSYVSGDGTVGGRKSTGRWINDLFMAVYNFFALFFNSIMNPPQLGHSSTVSNTYVVCEASLLCCIVLCFALLCFGSILQYCTILTIVFSTPLSSAELTLNAMVVAPLVEVVAAIDWAVTVADPTFVASAI